MNYLKAEHLKFKRTISNKLLFIAPFLTALLAWIIGGFYGFQYMTFYWWYAFLLPGTIAILCSLAHQKEERAGKYYSVLSAPINLKRFEYAKALLMIEKLLIIASIWQIPLCLLLARKTGLFLPIAANTLLGILMPILLGNTALAWVCPYCWAAKTAELFMGIESNGTFAGVAPFSWSVLLPLVFSVILYVLLTFWDAANFSKKDLLTKVK